MFDTLISILVTVLVFGFLIFIHEFGHFICARVFGVTVNEFSIGMGPRLVWYESKKSGTVYSLAMLPIGGFVAMAGEDGESDDPNAFDKKPAWQRFIITAAGAVVNIVFGFLAMFIIVGIIFGTKDKNFGGTTVAGFATEEQMLEMGEDINLEFRSSDFLKKGDVILSVEGNSVYLADELSYHIMRYGDRPMDLVILRDGAQIELSDVQFPKMSAQGQTFGVMDFQIYRLEKNVGNFFSVSFTKTGLILRMCWESVIDLITGRYTFAAVSGPVGISSAIGDAVADGVLSVLNLVVIISINLGFMNLLPIPALDGGRLITLLAEMITRKRIPVKIEAIINAIGLAILLLLSLVIMVKDVFTLF